MMRAMAEVAYCSHVRVERQGGPMRLAYLPGETEPVTFGVHGAIAAHYKVPPDAFPAHASTIDYIVASTAG